MGLTAAVGVLAACAAPDRGATPGEPERRIEATDVIVQTPVPGGQMEVRGASLVAPEDLSEIELVGDASFSVRAERGATARADRIRLLEGGSAVELEGGVRAALDLAGRGGADDPER